MTSSSKVLESYWTVNSSEPKGPKTYTNTKQGAPKADKQFNENMEYSRKGTHG